MNEWPTVGKPLVMPVSDPRLDAIRRRYPAAPPGEVLVFWWLETKAKYREFIDFYYQADAPALGSNTATSVLVAPINLLNTNDAAVGIVSQAGARIAEGGQLQLRTYSDNLGSGPAFTNLSVSVLVEPDAT